jgi:hypothetical protein
MLQVVGISDPGLAAGRVLQAQFQVAASRHGGLAFGALQQ